MNNSDNDITSKQKEFEDFLKKAANQESNSEKISLKENSGNFKEVIHPNSLITKNISLFTKDPNYKLKFNNFIFIIRIMLIISK